MNKMNLIKNYIQRINEFRISLVLLISIYIYGILTFSGKYVDDAYITYRFAKHTAEGYLFVWNVGEMPIEGFSNPLWTIITSIFHVLNLLPIENYTYYFVAIIVGFVLIHLYTFATKTLKINSLLVVFFISFFLLGNYFWNSMFNGLETFLQMAILYFCVYYLTKPFTKRNAWIMSILIMLLILNRFEGFLYATVVVVSYVVIHYKNQEYSKYLKWLPFIIYAVTLFSVFIFRYFYFGELTPLSVAAKSGGKIKDLESIWLLLQNKTGWTYVIEFFTKTNLIALVPVFILALFFKMKKELLYVVIPVIFLFGGSCLIAIQNGGDWMRGFRMLSPFAPIFVLIFLLIISNLKHDYAISLFSKIVLFILLVISTYFGTFSTSGKKIFYFDRSYYENHAKNKGLYWNKVLVNNETYITERAGALPYGASKIKVLDFHGLVYPCVGRNNKIKGNQFGRRSWDCMFKKNFVLYDVNDYNSGVYLVKQASKQNIELEVVLKNKEIVLSQDRFITFVRKEYKDNLLKRDSSLEFIPLEEYRKLYRF